MGNNILKNRNLGDISKGIETVMSISVDLLVNDISTDSIEQSNQLLSTESIKQSVHRRKSIIVFK